MPIAFLRWRLGLDDAPLQSTRDDRLTFEALFERAELHPEADGITGVICGYRVEALNGVTRDARRMDKVVEWVGKGFKKMTSEEL